MTKFETAITCAFAFIACSTCANAQAFGIEMGTPLSELNVLDNLGDGIYKVDVSKPHPEFEFYLVKSTPETGVCRVSGVGLDHTNDRYGQSVRRKFSELKSILIDNYGPHYVGDYLENGALWKESNEWVMAIYQNERVYQVVWDDEERSNLPPNLKEIILDVNALNSDTSYINLQYKFSNHDACSDILRIENSDGL